MLDHCSHASFPMPNTTHETRDPLDHGMEGVIDHLRQANQALESLRYALEEEPDEKSDIVSIRLIA